MEVEKELRLPTGAKSWWDLLQEVPYQDNIPLKDNTNVRLRVYKEYSPICRTWDNTEEFFEADILTLKVRGFDELKEIIPSKQELIEHYHLLRVGTMGTSCYQKHLDFIQKLIDLT